MKPISTLTNAILSFFLFLCGSSCFVSFIFIGKPEGIWSAIVKFLNDGEIEKFEYKYDIEQVRNNINKQIKNIGINNIVLSASELSVIVKEKLKFLNNPVVKIQKNSLSIYTKIDTTIENNPLIGIIGLNIIDNNGLELAYLGTQKIKIPADLLPNAISKFILEDIDLKTFFNNIVFNNNPNIQVNKVNTLVFPHPAESYLQFEVNINFKLI